MTEYTKRCIECFDHSQFVQLLDSIDPILRKKYVVDVKFKKGEIVFKQGAFASHICLLRDGLVKTFLEFHDKNLILRVEPAGQLLGLQALCGKNVYYNTTIAYKNSVVSIIDIDFFKQLTNENSEFSKAVVFALAELSIASNQRLISLTQKKAHGRLADILLCLSERIYKSHILTLSFPKRDLAELSNMRAENLTRTLNELKEDNIIEVRGNIIEIIDMDRLVSISLNG